MIINKLNTILDFITHEVNEEREIKTYTIWDAVLTGISTLYPNVLLYSLADKTLYKPIDETIMSLKSLTSENLFKYKFSGANNVEENPVFFFIYNTENYYHFLYDTLPYLLTYFQLKAGTPSLKLLMNYPNQERIEQYKFVLEFLEMLGITEEDILIANTDTVYRQVMVSTSYTHGGKSNQPPNSSIYTLYDNLVDLSLVDPFTPKKIYVSRRSWIHNDFSNIGTNYTTRRSMVNETELVNYLISMGYTEVFTERMSINEKINLFNNATHVVGSIGGGLSNVLFSKPETKLIAIESPGFLEINKRFIYSLNRVDLKIFNDTRHIGEGPFLKFMRVKYNDIVGEIININGDDLTIAYSEQPLAGWNNSVEYKKIIVSGTHCVRLDNGLNSPWVVDLEKFKEYV